MIETGILNLEEPQALTINQQDISLKAGVGGKRNVGAFKVREESLGPSAQPCKIIQQIGGSRQLIWGKYNITNLVGRAGTSTEIGPQTHGCGSRIAQLSNGKHAGSLTAEAYVLELYKPGKGLIFDDAVTKTIIVTIAAVNKTERKEIRRTIIVGVKKASTSAGDRVVGKRRNRASVRI